MCITVRGRLQVTSLYFFFMFFYFLLSISFSLSRLFFSLNGLVKYVKSFNKNYSI